MTRTVLILHANVHVRDPAVDRTVMEWDARNDAQLLDDRTAKVLALGEWFLSTVKHMPDDRDYIEHHRLAAPVVAALQADGGAPLPAQVALL